MKYKKFLGQHFLHDTVKIARMLNEINPQKKDVILEIGPGSGMLTKEIIKRTGKVIAVEIDKEAINRLKEKIKNVENLKIIHNDFLKINIKDLYEKERQGFEGRFLIVGNIPYYITGPIIEKIIENRKIIDEAYLTVQKEVAKRIVAKEGSKDFGNLSIFVQFYCEPEIIFKIDRKAFYPVPEVDSAFIRLKPDEKKYKVKDKDLFFKIVKIAFSQRRKMLINNLSEGLNISKEEIKDIFTSMKLPLNIRAEQVSLIDFIKISDIIYNILNKNGIYFNFIIYFFSYFYFSSV